MEERRHKVALRFMMIVVLMMLMVKQQCKACGAEDAPPQTCQRAVNQTCVLKEKQTWDYAGILAPSTESLLTFNDLPGFTRSVYGQNFALITPESRVWSENVAWGDSMTAHLISPAIGANFAMYLVNMRPNGTGQSPFKTVERFILVLEGSVEVAIKPQNSAWSVNNSRKNTISLVANEYAYFPAGLLHSIRSRHGAGMVVYERKYEIEEGKAHFLWGSVQSQPMKMVPGEVFELRRLLPATEEFDFNVHVMDFLPGQHLNVKEVHYNQHGLLLLSGKGIYRLADQWMPITQGDALWMAPFCPQWFAALGEKPTRYLIYKDTTIDPIHAR